MDLADFEVSASLITMLHEDSDIDNETYVLLLAQLEEELNQDDFVDLCRRIDLNNLPQPAKELFRFSVEQIHLLCDLLKIPEKFVTKNRHAAPGWEVFCMLLRRFAYPCRLSDLKQLFGRHKSQILELINELASFLHSTWNERVFWPEDLI